MDPKRAEYAGYDGEASFRSARCLIDTRPSSSSMHAVSLDGAEKRLIDLGLL
jgi:hypothetical protein